MNKIRLCAAVIGCAGLLSASANTITYNTATGTAAQATFVTGAGSLIITLQNLGVNPGSVAECISGLSFGFNTGQTAGTLTSSSGLARDVASNRTYTDGAVGSTGWGLTSLASGLMLDPWAGGVGPEKTIIGAPAASNKYDAAGGSIAGNGPHNPFLAGPVAFTLSIKGLTADSIVNSVTFRFGTAQETGWVPGKGETPPVPDGGTTVLLLGAAISGLALVRRKLS